jgi:predicted  nucleic acid-binding Zn-ribbon protein
MIQALLNYQVADAKLNEIEKRLAESPERKKAYSAKKYLEGVEANVNKLDDRAAELMAAYEDATNEQLRLKEQEAEIVESVENATDEKEVAFLLKKAEELISKIKALGAKASKISEEIQAILKEYSNIKATTKAAQTQYADNAKKYNELKKEVSAEKEAVEKELESLKEKVDPALMEKYLKKRANKIYPVLYALKGNGCGACFMELSMSEINRLKNGEVIDCDQCGRLIYQG